MKISYNWLQSYIEEPLPKPEVLAEKIIFGAFEVEEIEQHGDDSVFDIKILPDRAHDCLSHYGIAREVSGLLGLTLKPLTFKTHTSAESDVHVSLESPVCRRYIARKIFGVKVGPSPEWLSQRLEAIGQRSINNIVDATNYVMFSLGQPIHAFDGDKMASDHIIIRQGKEGESITTLDGKIVALDETITVITDERHPLAIAGIKGGTIAEVTSETTSIILEVANFDPTAIRKAAKKVNLQNDSMKRFENELTPHMAGIAIHMVTDLIVDFAGGQPFDPIDEYPNPVFQKTVTFSADYINSILGTTIAFDEIKNILNRYGYAFEEETELFKVFIPYERIDIAEPHDMIEEIGRAYGYENIPATLPEISFTPTENAIYEKISSIKKSLIVEGYSEVQTYSFTKKGDFEVARGAVGKSALRTSLVPGLTASFALNKQNADLLGLSEVKIFEIGTAFPKSGEVIMVGIADKSGVKEVSLADYSIEGKPSLLEGGDSAVAEREVFKMWSEYPFITRDISFWTTDGSDHEISLWIENAVQQINNSTFHLSMRMFDTFTKDGKTSYGFRLVFQSFERTLTNEEVDKVMENVYTKVKEKGWEVR